MSNNLYWRTVPADPDGKQLGSQLKYTISQELFGHDGSLYSEWITVSRELVGFLRGVAAAAGSNDELRAEAEKLIRLIQQHGEVQLSIDQ